MRCVSFARQISVLAFVWSLPAIGFLVAEEPAGDSAVVNGTWEIASVEVHGEERPLTEDVYWVIKDSRIAYGGEHLATLVLYSQAIPKAIDLKMAESGKEYEGIYAVENDIAQGAPRRVLNQREVECSHLVTSARSAGCRRRGEQRVLRHGSGQR